MRVLIKSLGIDMQVKSKGIEFEVRSPDNSKQLGDVYLTKTGLIWCKGRTDRSHGKWIAWDKFISMMNAR
ncbi:MAG TPA: hypothetical protein VM431_08535 [Phycisphaerae bacterium]|nr:hypothetical protein [Phycisphaerae bacterium]